MSRVSYMSGADVVKLTPLELPLVKRLLLYGKEFGESDFWLGFTRDDVQVLEGILERMQNVDVTAPFNLDDRSDVGRVSPVFPNKSGMGKSKSVKMRIYRVSFSLREAGVEYFFNVDVKAQNGVEAKRLAIAAYDSECPWRPLGLSVGCFVPHMYCITVRRKEECTIYYPDTEDEITYNVCTLVSSRSLN